MVLNHDFKKFPELTNSQLDTLQFVSPHVQYTEDFEAVVDKVTDGDTVSLLTSSRDFAFPLRILDIDAPEMSQGGKVAKEWLANRLTGKRVTINIDPSNRVGKYGRLLGRIIHNGLSVGEEMIHLGLVKPFGEFDAHEVFDLNRITRLSQWV